MFFIFLGYFGVRFFGQGVLTSSSRNVLILWFVRRRGLVSGIRGVFVSIGFSIAPLVLAWLILEFGWREALWVLAITVGIGFSTLALIFVRDSPESCGLIADGLPADSDLHLISDVPSKTLREARRSPVFWIYSMSLGMHAMFGTALTFHIVSIFEEAGRGREEAFGYFIPAAIFSTTTNIIASWMVDFLKLKPFLIVMLVGFIIGAYGLMHLDEDWGFWLLAAGFGTGGRLWGVTSNLAYIRFFGPCISGRLVGSAHR